jgi:hypothetical protein
MTRPSDTSRRKRGSFLALGAFALAAIVGCADPNFIGLQDFGTINGNVVDQNGKAVQGAVVSSTGTGGNGVSTQSGGAFNLVNVAVGEQTVTVTAAGYQSATATVIVVKNGNVTAGNVVITSTVAGH